MKSNVCFYLIFILISIIPSIKTTKDGIIQFNNQPAVLITEYQTINNDNSINITRNQLYENYFYQRNCTSCGGEDHINETSQFCKNNNNSLINKNKPKCKHCNKFGHQRITHKDCDKNPANIAKSSNSANHSVQDSTALEEVKHFIIFQ